MAFSRFVGSLSLPLSAVQFTSMLLTCHGARLSSAETYLPVRHDDASQAQAVEAAVGSVGERILVLRFPLVSRVPPL